MFEWVFKEANKRIGAHALARRLRVSEKLAHAWAVDESSYFHRENPLDRAFQVLEFLYANDKSLFAQVWNTFQDRFSKPPQEDPRLSDVLKEVNEAVETALKAVEDGSWTEEELEKFIKEGSEALEVLSRKLSYARLRLEQMKPIKVKLNGR